MEKSFGDAMVIDLKTRIIRCLTCDVPAMAFQMGRREEANVEYGVFLYRFQLGSMRQK
jgi:hypothetical protein